MTAQLQIAFLDPPPAGFPNQDAVRQSVLGAFYEWARHFDTTTGVYTLNVSYQPRTAPIVGANTATIYGDTYLTVGSDPANGKQVVTTAFGLGFAARSGVSPSVAPMTLYINPTNLVSTAGNILAPLEREFGHALGIRSFRGVSLTQPFPAGSETAYDVSVRGVEASGARPSTTLTFFGPNAQVAYGGTVLLSNADASNPINPGGSFIDPTQVAGFQTGSTATPGSTVLTPLQVALLRDAGLPALTDQELLEHSIARLYFGAFGRVADSAGLVLQTVGFQTALSGLVTIADQLLVSAEFTGRYGTLSDPDFVRTVFQNVFGRAATADDVASGVASLNRGRFGFSRGGLLNTYAQSDEARGRLSANANVTYSGTAEAQVARLYDTAFGRDADPSGFVSATQVLINGATLGQVARGFLGSAEFANRYGAAPSDAALVTGLYQNTLGRSPEAAGLALYTNALSAGLSRADLLVAFSESQEHTSLLIAKNTQPAAAGFASLNIVPHLGIIPTLTGVSS